MKLEGKRKKATFEELFRFPSEENDTQYKSLRNQTRKVVASAVRRKTKLELNNLCQNFTEFSASLEE